MINSLKTLLWSRLAASGIEIRRASKRTGVNALLDVKKIHGKTGVQTIFDVGANVGQSALQFQKRFPAATIHSFEPVQASYNAGSEATAEFSSIVWHKVAVGNTTGSAIIYSDGVSQLASLAAPDSKRNFTERNEVAIIRLEDFCSERGIERIDLLKTDSEGFDLSVLEGAESMFAGDRIGCVLCEVGFCLTDTGHSFFPPIAAFLEKHGWRLFHFYGMSGKEHFDQWGVCYADALFAKPRKNL